MRASLLLVLAVAVHAKAASVSGAGNVDIHFTRSGSGGANIILVHGWICDSSYWRNQVAELAADNTVIAIDLAGHGESGSNRDDWSITAFGEDVAAVVDAQNMDEVILVGHSMGGAVVIEAARRLGQSVRLIVAVDTMQEPARAPYTDEQSRELWAPFAADFTNALEAFVRKSFFLPAAPPDMVNWVAKDMASADADVALAAGHALTTWSVPDGISSINHIPFVLINADYRPTDAEGLASLHPDARLIVLSDVGHFPMLVKPEEFNAVLASVIQSAP